MTFKLLTEQHLEFLSLRGSYPGLSVYSCQITTLLEITCRRSYVHVVCTNVVMVTGIWIVDFGTQTATVCSIVYCVVTVLCCFVDYTRTD